MLRGALGQVLAQSASPEALASQPCSYNPPCCYELFHNAQGKLDDGQEVPKPYILRADRKPGVIRLTLRLFGQAQAWRHGFHEGWIAAARQGLELDNTQVPFKIRYARLDRDVSPAEMTGKGPVRLDFETPLVLRSPRLEALRAGQKPPQDVVMPLLRRAVAQRLHGMASWQDEPLLQEPDPLDVTAMRFDMRVLRVRRGPKQWRTGLTGAVTLHPQTARNLRLLQWAQACHIGADTVVGAGRFRLVPVAAL